MITANSREEILTRIRQAQKRQPVHLLPEPDWRANSYKEPILPLYQCFANELEAVNGQCSIVDSEAEAMTKVASMVAEEQISSLFCRDTEIQSLLKAHNVAFCSDPSDFMEMQAGVTRCEYLIARTGSVMVSSAHVSGRQMNVFPPIHVVLAKESQLVPYLEDAYIAMQAKYDTRLPSMISLITGPSRTADIEKTLVLGAHGPKKLWVILVKDKTATL
jgi:L-lactate dehydrogenase complex protein LldG